MNSTSFQNTVARNKEFSEKTTIIVAKLNTAHKKAEDIFKSKRFKQAIK